MKAALPLAEAVAVTESVRNNQMCPLKDFTVLMFIFLKRSAPQSDYNNLNIYY